MAGYKDRVRADLDRWIEQGLVAEDKRAAILATLPETRRLDAATALAWIGGALLGIAIITFVAANWDGIARIVRFALLLAAFALTAGAGAWFAHKARPLSCNIALTLATLIFAAAIGLTGQIFDIAGEPRAALYLAGAAGFALAFAGRATGAATAAVILIGLGDFDLGNWLRADIDAPWLVAAAPLGAMLALRWKSAPLAHASAIGILAALFWYVGEFDNAPALPFLFAAALAGAAFAARWLFKQADGEASVFYGWALWGALMFFAIAGYVDHDGDNAGIFHRLAWLAASCGAVALGRFDQHRLVTAIGVISTLGAIAALLFDLGLDLMTAAGIFFLCALAAMIGGLMLRKRTKSAAPEEPSA
jgi:hypothetical protein